MNNIIEDNYELIGEKVIKPMFEDGYFPLTLADKIEDAIEKQIPRKPITYDKTNRADCPVCEATVRGINKPYGNYCSGCGQAIDWRNEDE